MKIQTKFRLLTISYLFIPFLVILWDCHSSGLLLREDFQESFVLGLFSAFLIWLLLPSLAIRWLLLDQIPIIKALCKDIHEGRYRRIHLPNEPVESEEENELNALMRHINWMVNQIWQREKQLRETIEALETSRKALFRSEERFRRYFELGIVGMAIITPGKGWAEVNDCLCRILGYSREELKNMTWEDVTHADDLEETLSAYEKVVAGERDGYSIEKRYLRKDGAVIYVSVSVKCARKPDGRIEYFVALVQDITERRQARLELVESEKKLARARKMETLGTLVGGVAHDLNNILSGLVGYPELLMSDESLSDRARRLIGEIHSSGRRAAAIVGDMLTMARGVASSREMVNFNMLIRDYLCSPEYLKLKKSFPRIRVDIRLNDDLPSLSGAKIHLGKIIMNLITNAAEAVGEQDGIIRIHSEKKCLKKRLQGYEEIPPGDYVVLSVSDDGPGISEKDVIRIFEPFYSRKTVGRSGTGLGLTVVWNAVRNHNGYINVIRGSGGTCFEIYLPAVTNGVCEKYPQPAQDQIRGDGEQILVVDDLEQQRDIAQKMLTYLGYCVETVSGGEAAIEYLKENTADLVVLDMIMEPGINGYETYREIRRICPGQKAIIVSGYAGTEEVRRAQALGAGKFILKPYTLETIGRAVRDELYPPAAEVSGDTQALQDTVPV